MLTISFKKVSPTHHNFRIETSVGGKETYELETKTYLFHDLVHFAVESEAHLTNSFYGLLNQGNHYNDLSDNDPMETVMAGNKEALMTERVVGLMSGVLKQDATREQALTGLTNLLSASGEAIPLWFTEEYIARVKEHMRKLEGEWKGTPFGSTMTLTFSLD